MSITKEMLDSKWGTFGDLAEFSSQPLQDGRFSVSIDNGEFECLFHQGAERRLFVLLSGARNPAVQPVIKFDRWSWRDMFPGTVLYISDPTLLLPPQDLHIGWYVGTAENDWTHAMATLVSNVAARLQVPTRNVICYGSSAGGFGAMMLAAKLGDATAVAINPQTDVCEYSERFVTAFLDAAFGGRQVESLSQEERSRLSAVTALQGANKARCLIAQNVQDKIHFQRHYTPFCEVHGLPMKGGQDKSGRMRSIVFDSDTGHGPEPKDLAPKLIKLAVELSQPEPLKGNGKPARRVVVTYCLSRPRIQAKQIYLVPTKDISAQRAAGKPHPFVPSGRPGIPPYPLVFPLDWDVDPFNDRNWCAQLHMWRMMDAHLLQHSQTRDPEWLQFPLAVVVDWHRYHYVEKRRSKFAWRDMMVGLRAMKLAYLISHLVHDQGKLEASQQKVLNDLVRDHVNFLIDHRNVAYSNHTFIDIHGLAALAQTLGGEDRREINAFIDAVLGKLLAMQFDEHGVHLENSPGYQPFGIGCVKRLSRSQWFSRFKLADLIAKAEGISEWFLMPDGRTIAFGDTDGQEQDPSVTATVFQGRRQVFNCSGYAVVRDDGGGVVKNASLLGVMGAFHSQIHKQADDLSFVWFEGEDILCDAGKFSYNTEPRRDYAVSTRAHNTVEIDGANYGGDPFSNFEMVYGSAIGAVAVHDWGYLIDARVQHLKAGVEHLRFLAYCPGRWLLVMDRLSSEESHDYTQWFHFSPHLPDLVKQAGGYHTQLKSGKELRVRSAARCALAEVLEKGVETPRLQGWISQKYGEMVPNCALGYQQSGHKVFFATLLTLDDDDARLVWEKDEQLSLQISANGKDESYAFSFRGSSCDVRRV